MRIRIVYSIQNTILYKLQHPQIYIPRTRKDRTLKHLDPRRILKEKYLKIQTRNPILEVRQGMAQMIIELIIQVTKMCVYTCIYICIYK